MEENEKRNLDSHDLGSAGGGLSAVLAIPPIPADQYELRILKSLRQIIRAVEVHSRKLDHDFQITGPQLACLLVIRGKTRISVTRLAQAVFLSPGTVVGIVDRLEEKGLVERHRSKEDRRLVEISITDAGKSLSDKAPSPIHGILASALRELPDNEQISIAEALDKLVRLMNAGGIDAGPILTIGPMSGNP
ncbi:MAG: MarR family transcriptional regulator [Desulfuromonadaceae bacterium]|nr:MarR family transcriptional regulator [Desulfuromonadaceae bacterium]